MTYPQPPQGPYPPPPAPAKNNRTLIIVLAAVGVALLLLCGICGIVGLLADDPQPEAKSKAQPAATQASPTPAEATPAEVAAPPSNTTPPAPATPSTSPKVKMPNLVGENAAVAEDKLRALGFTRIDFGSQDETDTWVVLPANWTVAKQSAKAGASVSTDTLIVLTCTKKR